MILRAVFQEVGEYDKATLSPLQMDDWRVISPEDLPEHLQEVWTKLKDEMASLKEGWIVNEFEIFPALENPDKEIEIKVTARNKINNLPQPHVPMKIFTFNEIPTLKREDKEVIEFLRWFKETKSE